jgi:RNA polymerase sigma-70 factor, ECF subfamily
VTESEFIRELEKVQSYLERASLALMGNTHDAEDAVQEACLRAYVSRAQLQGGSASFRPWMKRILLNVCLRSIEHRKRVVPLGSREETMPDQETSYEELGPVWDKVKVLSASLRETVALRYVFDLTQEQVAQHLQVPLGTVKSRINRALEQLRSELAGAGKEGDRIETGAKL